MLQGFWGGVILSIVNQAVVFLVLGGLAACVVAVRRLLAVKAQPAAMPAPAPAPRPLAPTPRSPTSPALRVAAILAAIHHCTQSQPGSLRVVAIRPVETSDVWKMAGRLEMMGVDPGREDGRR